MFDFYGPINGTGPVTVTNQVPDEQINRLIQSLERNIEAMSRLDDEIEGLVTELGETKTVVASANILIDKMLTEMEANVGNETKLREVIAGFRAERESLAAGVAKGTAADGETPPTE